MIEIDGKVVFASSAEADLWQSKSYHSSTFRLIIFGKKIQMSAIRPTIILMELKEVDLNNKKAPANEALAVK